MEEQSPRENLRVDIDVPQKILDEAREELSESSDYNDFEDYILDRLKINLNY